MHVDLHSERALEPARRIVDAHHHLWTDLSHSIATYYPPERLIADVRGGHDIVGSVYLECRSHYLEEGPEELRPVGETEFVVDQPVPEGIMGGIVGFADVRLGSGVRPVLDAHVQAGNGRFRGVRYPVGRDPDPEVINSSRESPPGILLDPEFQRGVREVGTAGLLFETWAYFHQLDDLVELARSAPEVIIVLDHMGGPAGRGGYAPRRQEMLEEWRVALARAAKESNIVLKIGGLGFSPYLTSETMDSLSSSADIADYWRQEVLYCVEAFGSHRCMFESNYPVDAALCDYVTLWNAFKRIAAELSENEQQDLFEATAQRTYGLLLRE